MLYRISLADFFFLFGDLLLLFGPLRGVLALRGLARHVKYGVVDN